jgi:hypothetical protein
VRDLLKEAVVAHHHAHLAELGVEDGIIKAWLKAALDLVTR